MNPSDRARLRGDPVVTRSEGERLFERSGLANRVYDGDRSSDELANRVRIRRRAPLRWPSDSEVVSDRFIVFVASPIVSCFSCYRLFATDHLFRPL